MVKARATTKTAARAKRPLKPKNYARFTIHKRTVTVLVDKVLLFGLLNKLHGRLWGIWALTVMNIGLFICFLIRPDLLMWSTAFSDFGNDVRTAPYFAGSMFFAAYGLWRWRNYLYRTWERTRPFTSLISLTIFGLLLVALMPVSWEPWPYRLHFFGFFLAGLSMMATVVADGLLSKTPKNHHPFRWRGIRLIAVLLILIGGIITFGSAKGIEWFAYSLLGEYLILAGYSLWIWFKTYLGEGSRTRLSKLLKNIVIVD